MPYRSARTGPPPFSLPPEIIQRYREGELTISEAAAEAGCCYSTARKALHRAKVVRPHVNGGRRLACSVAAHAGKHLRRLIWWLMEVGYPTSKIAEVLGVGAHAVQRFVRDD